MNGKERMALAMRNEVPDRVPVMCQLAIGHYLLNCDLPPHVLWFSSEAFAEALVDRQRQYGFDGILINLTGRPGDLLDHVITVEQTPDGEKLTWDNGATSFHPWDDNPIYSPGGATQERFDFLADDPTELDHVDDFSRYTWDAYQTPFLPGKTDTGLLTDIPEYFFNTIDRVLELVDGEVSVHGEVFSPFSAYMDLVGYEVALLGLAMDPAKAHALLELLTPPTVAWAVAQVQRGCDAVLISSAFAGGPMISPRMYEEFVLPYEKQVIDAVQAQGHVIYTHTCGSIGDRLEHMIATGTAGIDTLDPPPLGTVNLADAKAEVGGRVFLKGNMDSVAILQAATADEVLEHATDRITAGMPAGGYILSTACSVAPHVEPWKLELLAPLAKEIGRYS